MLGTTLGGRYQIYRYLGGGGFGRTYLAHDQHLPGTPDCVVKQLKPRINHPRAYHTACRLFNREAEVLYRLGEHDRIPRLFAHFEEEQEFYLVQEFVDGEVLSRTLRTGHCLSEPEVIQLLKDLLTVLAFVHKQHVIHRDIKPSNLIRRHDGTLVMIDFGGVKQISADADAEWTITTMAIGSAGYMPNEQLAGRPRYSSDIYAAGMVAVRAVTGRSPSKLPEDLRTGELCWRDRAPHISNALAHVLTTMSRYDFRERYATAEETLAALDSIGAEAITFSSPPSPVPIIGSITPETSSSPITVPTIPTSPISVPSQCSSPILPPPPSMITAIKTPLEEDTTVTESMGHSMEHSMVAQPQSSPLAQSSAANEHARAKGDDYFQHQQYEDASAIYSQLLKSDPDDYILWFKQAMALDYLHRYEEAIACYRTVLNLQPQDYLAWSKLGKALERLEQYDDAVDAYTQVLQLQPQNYWAWHDQGRALESSQHIETAITAYEQAIQLKPDFQLAIDSRKRLLCQLNQVERLYRLEHYDEALESCLKTVETNPNDPLAWLRQGMTLENAQYYQAAVDAYNKVIQLDPNDSLARFRCGSVLEKLGAYDEAAQAYRAVTQLQSDNHWAWSDLGRILELMGQYEEAIAAYNQAIELHPTEDVAIAGRDRVLAKRRPPLLT